MHHGERILRLVHGHPVQSSSSATGHVYTGVWQAMRLITKDEGVAALYKGLSMNW